MANRQAKQLNLKNVVLLGRTFEEYRKMFSLNKNLLKNESILDVASGVSSFCAEANAKGYNITASDRIYACTPSEIEQKCRQDLDMVLKQLPDIADLYVWDFFKEVQALRNQREKAYKLFIEDFKGYGIKNYVPVEYPSTNFPDNQFSISLSSGFLFLYDDLLDYDFHRKTILERMRITTKEIRIWPIVNMKGNKSSLVEPLINDNDLNRFQIFIEKVDYEFLRNSNEMMVIKTSK